MGRKLVEVVKEDAAAKAVWVWAADERVEAWLLTDPMLPDVEARLVAATTTVEDRMQERHPTMDFRVHVLNPAWYGASDPTVTIPAEAKRIWSRS
jgi:hypothetical protein